MIDAALAASSRQRWPASQFGHLDPFLTVYRVLPGETGLLESNRALLEGVARSRGNGAGRAQGNLATAS
ncbi:hypothetical protein D9D06_19955 [Pseudomonas aeruginosa]|nr:hypothetical protein D9D06_19955 [Pseudomonas aeruginosa]